MFFSVGKRDDIDTPCRIVLVFVSVISLSGCAGLSFDSQNNVNYRFASNGKVELASDGRYNNIYPKEKEYPTTCEEGCYREHPNIQCDDEACLFTGKNPEISSQYGVTVNWLGHASYIIQFSSGEQFLFDPVSKQFDWPVNLAHQWTGGHVRREPVWPSGEALQNVDAVLYSHLHYDHFNKDDIVQIGNRPTYFVHQDTADYLPSLNLNVEEVSWFSHSTIGSVEVHAIPAHHFNSRFYVPFIYDDNEKALWGGWLLKRGDTTVLFAGDTGYSEHFNDIVSRYGEIDICLLPIASYHHPEHGRWYRYVHMTPEDAMHAANDLKCKVLVPWGYGNASWQMGDISSHSALTRFLNMRTQLAFDTPVVILNEGDKVIF